MSCSSLDITVPSPAVKGSSRGHHCKRGVIANGDAGTFMYIRVDSL